MKLQVSTADHRPLICHVIYRLDYGGLENGVVNIINRLPDERYRHVILTLAGFSDYGKRLRKGIAVESVDKQPGLDLPVYYRLWRRYRELSPDIVHTRNLSTLESQLPALLARVKNRIHGEHGRDMHDLDNTRMRYRMLRKIFGVVVKRYIAVSRDLEDYLTQVVGVSGRKITRICNGVDTRKFHPIDSKRSVVDDAPFDLTNRFIVGTIGRMQSVKDQLTLARAFIKLTEKIPNAADQLGLVMVGDGPLREEVRELLRSANVLDIAWLPGARDDTPQLLRAFNAFALPSLAEGISNTILEAMATGLPVVATDVGGNSELVVEGETGFLVPRDDPESMADVLDRYFHDPGLCRRHGASARERACVTFSLDTMVCHYSQLYDDLLVAQ